MRFSKKKSFEGKNGASMFYVPRGLRVLQFAVKKRRNKESSGRSIFAIFKEDWYWTRLFSKYLIEYREK